MVSHTRHAQGVASSSHTTYRHAIPALVSIARAEGLRAMYKGLGARLARLGPGGGIMIVAYDTVRGTARQ